jgi:hypothetical protein
MTVLESSEKAAVFSVEGRIAGHDARSRGLGLMRVTPSVAELLKVGASIDATDDCQ